MTHRIHIRIFLPVLLLIIMLPLAAWFIFSITSDWYVRHTAHKNVTELMKEIENEDAKFYDAFLSSQEGTKQEKKEASKELLNRVKGVVKAGHLEAGLIVLNSKMKQVYPATGQEGDTSRVLWDSFREMLEAGMLQSGNPAELEIGNERYAAELLEMESEANIKAKYFIGYAQIPNTALLLTYTGNLIAVIAAVGLFLAGIVVWAVAGSIAKPLEALCRQTQRIGDGTYQVIREQYSVTEVENLKEAFNRMAEKLKDAEEQNRRFFQNVSHDLRTPLVSIAGYAQGIQCGVMKEPEKAAEIILSESLRMTNLVESILTISKMDNSELKLNRINIDMEEFLAEQTEILRGLADGKMLIMTEGDGGITVEADPDLLIRIFQNVVSNCLRYAESRVEIRLSLEEQQAVIRVEDDGPGITEEEFPHIFERYYQGKNGHFGIGLSVVWSGMEYMGGSVGVANKTAPEHGVVYSLYLPAG